jgi:rod shape determining protein RodA
VWAHGGNLLSVQFLIMTPFLRKLLGLNWLLLLVMLGLAVFGVIAIYSATYMREDPVAADFWRKQANWVAVGFFAFVLASLVDYHWIRWGALPMYLAGLFFLILTKFIGQKVYGARSWLHVGPINFQPAQLAVVAGIMVLSLFLSQFKQMHPLLRLLICGAIVGAPCLLILMQPDLGEVIIWVPVLLALLFIGGLPLRYLICIVLIGIAFVPIAINLGLKPYQQQRITAFVNPDIDKQGAAWAINQSLIAIGSGGWAGKGFKAPNTQIELGFLPATAVHNDYIFSAIGEQWGFVGGMCLIGGFALLLLTCLFVAFFAGDQFGLLLVIGITALIFTHIFQNVGMTISILPITGVPLPLISYSGSFALMIMFALGVVNSVWVHRKEVAG